MSGNKEPRIRDYQKPDVLVVPPGARGPKSMHPAHLVQPQQQPKVNSDDRGPIALDITELVRRKKEEKKLKKIRDVAGKAKSPDSPPSSSSSDSLPSPNTILRLATQKGLVNAHLSPLGSPDSQNSVSPTLSPRVKAVGAKAKKNPSSSKGKGKEEEGTKRKGGASGTRKKYKRKLRKTHSRKRR
jgi:hypothetical protein